MFDKNAENKIRKLLKTYGASENEINNFMEDLQEDVEDFVEDKVNNAIDDFDATTDEDFI